MIRKLPSGQYRLYSRKKNPKTGKRRNLGTFAHARGGRRSTSARCSISSGTERAPPPTWRRLAPAPLR